MYVNQSKHILKIVKCKHFKVVSSYYYPDAQLNSVAHTIHFPQTLESEAGGSLGVIGQYVLYSLTLQCGRDVGVDKRKVGRISLEGIQ